MTKPFIKPIITPEEAAGKVREGTTIMLGGFNYGGVPYTVIDALHDMGTRSIRVICVDAATATLRSRDLLELQGLSSTGR